MPETLRWRRVRKLFERSVGLPEEAREPFLAEACAGDPALLDELRAMLAEDAADDGWMEPPDHCALGAGFPEEALGRRLGPWRLDAILGHGGMSTVYLASRVDAQFEMRAAVKVVKRGMDTDDILRRFRNERQVLADLEHPGIARLLDGGATEDGLPYLVMEYVDGVPVDVHCDERRLTVEERIALFRRLCAPVQHAHEHGVVHRDLKPSNVLVTAAGEPKLLDFGIAKLLGPDGASSAADVTRTELRLMTPEYASPEQVRGGPITPASDVYGLGVLLYELLSGHRPYARTTRRRGELERLICERDPRRPSAAVVGDEPISARRGTDARHLRARLAGDLDTIVLKALRKEPPRRYGSVAALSADLGRSLGGRPVLARPDTWRYRATKFARRNRTVVAATVAVVVGLAIALAGSTLSWLHEAEHRRATERGEYVARLAAAGSALSARDGLDARRQLEAAPESLRGWEWRHLASRLDLSERTFAGHALPLHAVAVSPDGRLLATGGEDPYVVLWDVESGAEVARWSGQPGIVTRLAFSPDGARLLAVRARDSAALWDVEARELVHEWRHAAGVQSAALGPQGQRVATGGWDGSIRVWDAETGDLLHETAADGGPCAALSFHPDGARLAAGTQDGGVLLWNPETDARVTHAPEQPLDGLMFLPDGARLATSEQGTLRIRDGETGAVLLSIPAHGKPVRGLAAAPDGTRLATCSEDGTVRLWNAQTGEAAGVLLGHEHPTVTAVAFLPDGARLATASGDRTARLWRADAAGVPILSGDRGWWPGLALSPDGAVLVEGGAKHLTAWSPAGRQLWTRTSLGAERGPSALQPVAALALGPDVLAEGAQDGRVALRDATTGAVRQQFQANPRGIWDVAVSPDGERVATAGADGELGIWSTRDGTPLLRRMLADKALTGVAFAPDAARVATCSGDGTARILDAATGAELAVLRGHTREVWDVAYAPDGLRVATASWDGTVRLWDARDGAELAVLTGHEGRVYCLAFHPDGTRLVSGGVDATLRVWDPDRGEELATLRGHRERVDELRFAPDGSFLVSKARDGEVRIWRTLAAR